MSVEIYDDRICQLGEGPLWHPERKQLFWFDIMGKRLLTRDGDTPLEWQFDEHVSAAGWTGRDTLLVASETGLWHFDVTTGGKTLVCALEADNPDTRSNDGRADPWGGFWIGTMGKLHGLKQGAIYRFYKGELRKIIPDITISNTICFNPNAPLAFYSDTVTHQIMAQPLNPDTGWPMGAAHVLVDLNEEGLNPDGAVVDSDGNLWVAEWGAFRVSCYDVTGTRIKTVEAPAEQCSCPAFGGTDLTDLYITTAIEDMTDTQRAAQPGNGKTLIARGVGKGLAEYKVLL